MEKLTENEIKQIFFYVDDKDKTALYADDVNVVDFARKIEAVVALREHERCVHIASSLNTQVGAALKSNPPIEGGKIP